LARKTEGRCAPLTQHAAATLNLLRQRRGVDDLFRFCVDRRARTAMALLNPRGVGCALRF
jgi:hypothetical protein